MNEAIFADYARTLPVAFQFEVLIGRQRRAQETAFREVSGIESEMETESVVEGGENRFVHQLPKGIKHPRLVLKRGVAGEGNELLAWCRRVFDEKLARPIVPRQVQVRLLGVDGKPLRAWTFEGAYPVKWSVDALQSTRSDVAIESIELAYATLTRDEV